MMGYSRYYSLMSALMRLREPAISRSERHFCAASRGCYMLTGAAAHVKYDYYHFARFRIAFRGALYNALLTR